MNTKENVMKEVNIRLNTVNDVNLRIDSENDRKITEIENGIFPFMAIK